VSVGQDENRISISTNQRTRAAAVPSGDSDGAESILLSISLDLIPLLNPSGKGKPPIQI
jgi:hypothetical protein